MTAIADLEFFDSHVHFWRPEANDWYPGLAVWRPELVRDHLPDGYRTAADGVEITGVVHVSAVTKPGAHLDETRWLDETRRATGDPAAIIGTVDPSAPLGAIAADLDAQAESPAFRGIRVFDGLDPEAAGDLFRLLGDRDLVFDLVVHPGDAAAHAAAAERAPGTAFVLEHAGWPDGDAPDQFRAWRDGVARLAALPHVDCKISGLGMALGTLETARLRPFVETCLELFGVERCFFGSNFPVDGVAGTFPRLIGAYREIVEPLSGGERRRLFSGNARRRYRA
jgi:predicted TIM-barrel fold metal-dependent hydrolase